MEEDFLAVIVVLTSFRNGTKFDSGHFLFFEKKTRPASMMFVRDASLQKGAGLLEHGRLFVVTKDDAMPVRDFSDWWSSALKQLCPRLSDQTFCRRIIAFRLGRTRDASAQENGDEGSCTQA